MAIIIDASNKQDIVLAVNMLSFKKTYVIIAKTKLETPKPISLDAHNSPVVATIFFTAYQKHKPIGIANIRLATIGLFFHHSQVNCELNWNQAKIFPTKKYKIPNVVLPFNVNSQSKRVCSDLNSRNIAKEP